MGFSLGSFSIGSSRSRSSSQATSSDSVFLADYFRQLFGDSSSVAGNIATSPLTSTANRLFDSGAGFLSELEGIAAGRDPGSLFLADRVGGGNGVLDEQIAGLTQDLEKFFTESLQPNIRSDAVVAGQLGGSRQGVAEGIAAEGVTRELARGITDLRSSDLAQRQEAARALTSSRADAATRGLSFLPQQLDFMNAATFAPLSPFVTLAQILGDPTVLNESQSSSSSTSKSFNLGLGS